MKYLIVGGAGFIGSYLTQALVAAGHRVTCVDGMRPSPFLSSKQEAIVRRFRAQQLQGATLIERDFHRALPVLGQFDVVVHLGALPLETPFDSAVSRQQITGDIALTYDVIRFLKQFPAKLVYLSSIFAYGSFDYATTEDRPLAPTTCYGLSKAMSEQLIAEQLTNWNVVRTTSVYGFGDLNNRATQILLSAAMNTKPAWVNDDAQLDFIYVKDLVAGIVRLCERVVPNQAFHISGGQTYTLREYAELLKVSFPAFSYDVRTLSDRPRRGALINRKAKQLLGWEPQYSLQTGLADYIPLAMHYNQA